MFLVVVSMNWLDGFPLNEVSFGGGREGAAGFKIQSPQVRPGLMMGAPLPFLFKTKGQFLPNYEQ